MIRGNEKDVEAVMQVIQAIERMAQGTTPGIHVQFLNHVDSESLAALLTEVYEKLTTIKQGSTSSTQQSKTVNVVAVSKPNAVLVIAPPVLLEGVIQLIDELDQPVDPATEVEIFRLKHAIASQVVTLIESHYEERVGLGTKIAVTPDARTNSVIVQAKPNELGEIALPHQEDRPGRLKRGLTDPPHQAPNYAVADELAAFLQNALQQAISPPSQLTTQQGGQFGQGGQGGASQAPQELRDSKSVVLEFLAKSDTTEKLVRSGAALGHPVQSGRPDQHPIVTAPQPSIPFIEELVAILDQPAAQVAEIKVFTLKNSDAESAVQLLTSIFALTSSRGTRTSRTRSRPADRRGGRSQQHADSAQIRDRRPHEQRHRHRRSGIRADRRIDPAAARPERHPQPEEHGLQAAEQPRLGSRPGDQPVPPVAPGPRRARSGPDQHERDPGAGGHRDRRGGDQQPAHRATPRYYEDIMRIARDLDQEPAQVIMQGAARRG